MDTKLKREWIAALKSGKYKQGAGRLRRGDEYCCLGVLCSIHPDVIMDKRTDEAVYGNSTNDHRLPNELSRELEISLDSQCTLIWMNDRGGYTFDEIADWIEENL